MTTPPDREMDAAQRPPWSAPRPDGALDRTLEREIESLAREARSRDEAREALALTLEWPEEPKAAIERQRHPAWLGWGALIAAVILAVAAAFVAVLRSPPEATAPSPAKRIERGLRMDPHLSRPGASLPRARPGRPTPRTGG